LNKIKSALANLARNALTDKDGDFCPGTAIGIATAVAILAQFVRTGGTDYVALANAQGIIIAAIAVKRWSETK
jgi:uncharacterized membrane protein